MGEIVPERVLQKMRHEIIRSRNLIEIKDERILALEKLLKGGDANVGLRRR